MRRNSAPSPAGAISTRCWPASRPRGSAGLAVKINAVALKNLNEDEIPALMDWAHGRGMALTLIEVMPMGDIGEGRIDQYLPLSLVRARLAEQYTLTDIDDEHRRPRALRPRRRDRRQARLHHADDPQFLQILQPGTDHLHRHTAHCLGHEDASDLRKPLRTSDDDELLAAAIDAPIGLKPKGHDFIIDRRHNRPASAAT